MMPLHVTAARRPVRPSRAAGFSIVELMIAIVIGLLALAFATRLVVSGEANKQAALGGSDSMQNGVLALFSIERELSQAGWGLNDPLINGCDTRLPAPSTGNKYALLAAPRGGASVTPLAPVVIQSVANGSDIISINAGSALSNTGMVHLSGDYTGGGVIHIDRAPYGFNGTASVVAGGDVIVVAPESPGKQCAISQVSAVVEGSDNQLLIASGGNNIYSDGGLGVNFSAKNDGGRVFNLGPSSNLSFHTWSLNANGFLMLRATNLAGTSASGAPVTDNIVAIKAQYGLDQRAGAAFDPEGGMQVSTWSGTMPDADGDGVAGSAGDYARIAAVRVAVVARSRNPEKPGSNGSCTATPATPFTVFGGTVTVPLAVAGDTVNWTCYRYRTFETIVPLRNSAWRPTA
ncbi:MAG: PilW family protein [Massilia sp.]